MRTRSLLPTVLALLSSFGPSLSAQDLLDTAASAGSFTTLLRAVDAAGLTDTLRGAGPFTVLAPTDAAFAALPDGTLAGLLQPAAKDQLVAILEGHVVAGRVAAVDALRLGVAETLNGTPLRFELRDGALRIGSARAVQNDIAASNGIIHVIDSVLLPTPPKSAVAAARDVLRLAIERGVPLFNAGNEAACAAIYEVAARAVAEVGNASLAPAVTRGLARSLTAAAAATSPRAKAWALRSGLDRALVDLDVAVDDASTSPPAAPAAAATTKLLFGFDDPSHDPKWFTVNDDVMGGVSEAAYEIGSDGTASFRGALSLANNGGFATIRSPAADLQLAGYDGLELRVRGDGRTYALNALRSDRRGEINTWRTAFATESGEWRVLRVPFTDLAHTVMGRVIRSSGPLAPENIRSVSFQISDKNEAPFKLEIDWIRAYRS